MNLSEKKNSIQSQYHSKWYILCCMFENSLRYVMWCSSYSTITCQKTVKYKGQGFSSKGFKNIWKTT